MLAALAALSGCGGNSGPLASASASDMAFVTAVATWDLNRDGNVTCNEWKQYAASLFKDADRDRDGFLSPQEFQTMSRKDRLFETIGFNYFDADGNGRVSLAELADKPNPAFALLDKNGDCVISSNEQVHLADTKRPEESRPVANPIPGSGRPGGY
ncbi:MAG: histidine kinase [Hyphomicrobiaceae bacterium]|nr:histidine kinase [Hyphomicrobiaceae bacterium]